jgi:hypothetical protein
VNLYPRGPLARELSQITETLRAARLSVTIRHASTPRIPAASLENIRLVEDRLSEIVAELERGASSGEGREPK